jgi:aminoglycoside 3-N-acetyltransferase
MISFRECANSFRDLGLDGSRPVIVHASLSSVGEIRGGAETLVGALLTMTQGIMAPTFTYRTMVMPESGPADNAAVYGSGRDRNRLAEFFQPDMPADPMMGVLPEVIRGHAEARRSSHPILSFAGIGVDEALAAQRLEEPLAPVGKLSEQNGIVLLIGVNHTVNTSIHYVERLAGRKQFIRWALTPQGVRECQGFPGCSDGFEQAAVHLAGITRMARLGGATVRAVPLRDMTEILLDLIREQPEALLCSKEDERCATVRRSIQAQTH